MIQSFIALGLFSETWLFGPTPAPLFTLRQDDDPLLSGLPT